MVRLVRASGREVKDGPFKATSGECVDGQM
jgi:hypothetical protein